MKKPDTTTEQTPSDGTLETQNSDSKINTEKETETKETETKETEAKETETIKAEAKEVAEILEESPVIKNEENIEETEDTEDVEDPEDDLIEEIINYEDFSIEELIGQFEILVNTKSITEIKSQVLLIRSNFTKKTNASKEEKLDAFIKDGGKKEDFPTEPLPEEEKFNTILQVYKGKRKLYIKEQEDIKQNNLKEKNKTLEELKVLIDSQEPLKKTYDEFRNLQERWKEIGQVPRNEANDLWQNYHLLVEQFLNKVKINKELKDLDLKKNLELKIELCEKVEELILEPSINKSFRNLQKLHDSWKSIGPISQRKTDEVWERFKTATEKINDRRKDHYKNLSEQQEKNYNLKTELCVNTEEVAAKEYKSLNEWQEGTNNITELQKVWKTIGYAPSKLNDAIWDRFRAAIDMFFEKKKEYFGKFRDEQNNNYNLKLELCYKAEAFSSSTNWSQTTKDLIGLQKEWKTIGSVPRKHSDKIWKRFRSACNTFFDNKENYFANINSIEDENMESKLELIKKINDYKFGENNKENLEVIKNFQREWMNVGHVPVKKKNELQNKYREALDKQFDKLKLSSLEKNTLSYKTKFEEVSNTNEGRMQIDKERNFIRKKAATIQNDINLWENNLGFFSNSKGADSLKEEFTKKIDNARKEIVILEEKIKFLSIMLKRK